MGSLKISSDTPRPNMSPFKAPLWKSVLAMMTVTLSQAGAAPVELVAGRVVTHEPVAQNIGIDINSLRSLFSTGLPAGLSLVRTVPHAQVHTVPHAAINTVRTLPINTAVAPTVLRNTPHVLHSPTGVSTRHHVQTPAVSAVRLAPAPVVAPVRVAPAPVVAPVRVAPAPVRVAPAPVVVQTPRVAPVVVQEEENLIPANYNFGYSVSDIASGDSKTRQEQRDGDVVTGSYSVADPDGRIRTVTYTADSVHGFQAKVTYDGEEGPVAIPFNPPATSAPILASAPVIAPVQPPAPVAAPAPAPAPAAAPVEDEGVVIAKDSAPEAAPAPASTTRTASAPAQNLNFVPRPVAAVPRLVNTFPQVDLNNFVRVLNNQDQVHALHTLPHGLTAVRTATGAPVDLSQFTFLSGGQVLV